MVIFPNHPVQKQEGQFARLFATNVLASLRINLVIEKRAHSYQLQGPAGITCRHLQACACRDLQGMCTETTCRGLQGAAAGACRGHLQGPAGATCRGLQGPPAGLNRL